MNVAQTEFQAELRADVAAQLEEVTSGITATVTAMANQMTVDGNSREVATNAAMSTLTATAAANTAALTSRMSALDASNTARMTALDSTITASLGSAVTALNASVTSRLGAVTTALASKRGMTSHMFSGGCSSRAHGGWYVSPYGVPAPVSASARRRPNGLPKMHCNLLEQRVHPAHSSSSSFNTIVADARSTCAGTPTASTGSSLTLPGPFSSSGPTP